MKPTGSRSIRMCSDFCQRESRASVSPASGRPKLSQAVCFVGTPTPALASQRREKLPCNPGGEASRCQSFSRRSPTAPFAQGSHLCLSKHNWLRGIIARGPVESTWPRAASRRWQNFLCLAANNLPGAGPQERPARHGTKKPPGGNLQGVFVQPCSPQRTFGLT